MSVSVNDLWLTLASLCGSGVHPRWLLAGLVPGLLLAGAAGGVMHCAPMCGPFVLGQVSDRLARVPAGVLCESHRLASGLLLPYHAGRITTYAALGALAGVAGAQAAVIAPVSRVLLVIAAALFLAQAARRLHPALAAHLPGLAAPPWSRPLVRFAGRMAAQIPQDWGLRGFALGLLLGFLPCGFLYAAIAVAAASSNAGLGALGMLAFGLGTAPALIVVGVAGQAAGRSLGNALAVVTPAVLVLNAGVLMALAWSGLGG